MTSQTQKIKELLESGGWHCTSEMYAMFISDPRRRLCDLKEKGFVLEAQKCKLHNYHNGGSKMWRLVSFPVLAPQNLAIKEFPPKNAPLFEFQGARREL